jgi:DNA-binding transcriptional LysR family regulator
MDLDGIAIFVKVIQTGSFSRAAALLGMPNSTVSAKVSALEKRLGVTLLQRTTRKLRVTQAGEAYSSAPCVRWKNCKRRRMSWKPGAGNPQGCSA